MSKTARTAAGLATRTTDAHFASRENHNPHRLTAIQGRTVKNEQPTAAADGTPAGNNSLDLNAVFARIADLDDEQLQDLVDGLDADLKDCIGGALDTADMDLITVAAAARITLRRRRAAAGRRQANDRIRQLVNKDTIGGTA